MVRAAGFLLVCLATIPAARADWITREEDIMGTRCVVELWSDDAAKGEAGITSVFDDMKRIDRLMSTWKEDTEISEVNRDAGKHPVKISEELFRLLQTSVKYSELTRGASTSPTPAWAISTTSAATSIRTRRPSRPRCPASTSAT